MHRDHDSIVSRSTDGPVVQARGFGRRAAPTVAPPPSEVEPFQSLNAALANDEAWRGPDRATRRRKHVVTAVMLVGIGLVFGLVLPNSTFGLPGCGSYEAKDLLTTMSREVLGKMKITYSKIVIAESAALPAEASGTHKCRSVILVDGSPISTIVYEMSWRVRLVLFNQYQVKVVSTAP